MTTALPESHQCRPGNPAAVSPASVCSQKQCSATIESPPRLQPSLALPGMCSVKKAVVTHCPMHFWRWSGLYQTPIIHFVEFPPAVQSWTVNVHCMLFDVDEFAEAGLSITSVDRAHICCLSLNAWREDSSLQLDMQSVQSCCPSLTSRQSFSPSSAIFCTSLCKAYARSSCAYESVCELWYSCRHARPLVTSRQNAPSCLLSDIHIGFGRCESYRTFVAKHVLLRLHVFRMLQPCRSFFPPGCFLLHQQMAQVFCT